jgi:hypothetical protein
MSDNLVVAWNKAALEAVRRTRMGPPIVARALHVLHAATYDAWAAHDEVAFGTRLGDRWRRPPAGRTRAAKEEAASFAAQRALADLFPSEATAFAKLMSELGYDPDAVGPDGSPSAVGVQAARAVLAFRHGDEANQLGDLGPGRGQQAAPYADWTGYEPVISVTRVVDPNRWQPLATPDGLGQRFLVPHWGLVAPFALAAGWELRPSAPTGRPRRPRRATGACSPSRSRQGTATTWTTTSSCSSPCRRPCWTPASPAGTPSGPTTRRGRSPPSATCSPARRCSPGAALGRAPGGSGARTGSPTSPPRRSPSTSRGTRPSARPRPWCWPGSPGRTASGRR